VKDLKPQHWWGMTSYFVAAASIGKVLGILAEELERGPTMPIDDFLLHALLRCPVRSGAASRSAQSG
jgi:hypothetical protein